MIYQISILLLTYKECDVQLNQLHRTLKKHYIFAQHRGGQIISIGGVWGLNQLYLKIKCNSDVMIVFILNLLIFTNTKEFFCGMLKISN